MKRCRDNCEGWSYEHSRVPDGFYKDRTRAFTNCPWCGSSLIDEPEMIERTIRIPKPMTERPKDGEVYYWINFAGSNCCVGSIWRDHVEDNRLFKRGLCYPTAELAIMAAKAMIG